MRKAHIFASALLTLMVVNINAQDAVPLEERIDNTLARMTTHEKIAVLHAQSKFTSSGVPRLGIRQLNMDDGPHGVREELEWNSWSPARWTNDSAVAFPSLTCLAATWNRQLARTYGNAISEEFAYRGKDLLLGPGANLARTPLNGRAFEYMGEDPLLAGEMAVNYIEAAQRNGVGCCMKHFVLNDQETDRFSVNVNVSERAMRELYLRPFEMAVKRAHVWSLMGSYNLWHNIHCCHNQELLCDILKDEWQWDGALVSDWGGTTDTWQAVMGGLDIEMGTYTDGKLRESEFGYNNYYLADPFEQLINEGKVPMEVLDEKVRRVLRLIYRTSMNPQKVIGSLCSEAHYQACREIAEEGITLLRNSGLLPLEPSTLAGKRVLVVGENATRSLTQGGGSSELKTLRDISPLEALLGVFGGTATVTYAQGYASGRAIYDRVDNVDAALQQRLHDEAIAAARDADLIIYVGGMNKNHRQDCENGDRENYNLSFGQDRLIMELADIQPHIIVCNFGGNAYATPWLDKVAALVHCWYLGSEAGTALVNILTGKTNPSGKLPMTFAHCLADYPSMMYGAEGYPGVDKQVYYKEGIFMGYRWFDLSSKDKKAQLKRNGSTASFCAAHTVFPFGYGLSYTSFSYGTPILTSTADGWDITVPVTNTGEREGKETVQLYVGRKGKSAVERPVKELKDFAKVNLKAGETKNVSLHLTNADLCYWNETTHAWDIETGTYVAYVCASSTDVRGQVQLTLR
ncbi:MAG: glycoside hydrolase family 3 C-terminal domain-containing protein [Bacteroidaceae bacterium]|nr:glycoside hydrolase family 3 C-terminal domain-containing protein [Bacteroidaceae bacterium]